MLNRRQFLGAAAAAASSRSSIQASALSALPSDPTASVILNLRITPVDLELGPGVRVRTVGYNSISPGPVLRAREGETVSVDVHNESDSAEVVHWHGLHIPSDVDGSVEEGTPLVEKGKTRRYTWTASPAGTRWYHTHVTAGRNLKRGLYTGQFGFLIIEPLRNPAAYDQEVLLAMHEWEPYMGASSVDDDSVDVAYKHYSINGRKLGAGEPVRVKAGQRVLFRFLNASATLPHRISFPGHRFQVVSMDGNPVPHAAEVEMLALGPAERIDATVTMNHPGVWILGSPDDEERNRGLGVVIEYAHGVGQPVWNPPAAKAWDYLLFGLEASASTEAISVPLVFEKKFAGHHWVDKWAINGQSYPKAEPIVVRKGARYRLVFDNRSNEAHPVHLHRHSFEIVSMAGRRTKGLLKDTIVTPPYSKVEVEFVADNPGPTLFHCHQQMHMDDGFMKMMLYC